MVHESGYELRKTANAKGKLISLKIEISVIHRIQHNWIK